MSQAEILAELANLTAHERQEILERLCELKDEELCRGDGLADWEKQQLDRAAADCKRDGDAGIPWRDAIAQVRASRTK